VFRINVSRAFGRRAEQALDIARRATSSGKAKFAVAPNPRLGAVAALGAIALGGAMLVANIAQERREVQLAGARAAASQKANETRMHALSPVQPTSSAPATTLPALSAPEAKLTARVDMTPTGAIAKEPPPTLRRKPHARKKKIVDGAN
jgi:hypothetical protein